MTIALTNNVAVRNIAKVRVTRFVDDDGQGHAVVFLRATQSGAGGADGAEFAVVLDDVNPCTVAMANAQPIGINDAIVPGAPTAFANAATAARNAYAGAGGRAAAYRALETLGIATGWISSAPTAAAPTGFAGVVS